MENHTQLGPLTGWQLAVVAIAALLLAWLCCGVGLLVGGVAGFEMGRASARPEALTTPEWRITPAPEIPTPKVPPTDRPYLGIRYIMQARGAEIAEVFPDSPAEKAGLQVGDIILEVDGQQVRPSRPLAHILLSYRPGDRVVLTVEREREEMEIPVTLGRRQSP